MSVNLFSEEIDEESGKQPDASTTLNMTVDDSQDLSDCDKSDFDDDDDVSKAVDHVSETSDSDDDDVDGVKPLLKKSKILSTSDDDDDDDAGDAKVTSSSNFRLVANCFFFHKLLIFELADGHDLGIPVFVAAL